MAKHDKKKRGKAKEPKAVTIKRLLRDHFAPLGFDALNVAERTFPYRVRADLQRAIDRLFADGSAAGTAVRRFCGVRKEYAVYEGVDFAGVICSRGGADKINLRIDIRQVSFFQRNPQNCRGVLH